MKKLTVKQQLKNAIQKYDRLAEVVKNYVLDLKAVKGKPARMYKASEQKPDPTNPFAPRQLNLVQVQDLITLVITARDLGYNTLLTASADELFINYVEKQPVLPVALQIL